MLRRPFVLSGASPDQETTYDALAAAVSWIVGAQEAVITRLICVSIKRMQVAKELVVLKHEARLAPELLYDKKRGIVLRLYTLTAAKEVLIHPADLRAR